MLPYFFSGSVITNEIRRSTHHALGKQTLELARAYLEWLRTGNAQFPDPVREVPTAADEAARLHPEPWNNASAGDGVPPPRSSPPTCGTRASRLRKKHGAGPEADIPGRAYRRETSRPSGSMTAFTLAVILKGSRTNSR